MGAAIEPLMRLAAWIIFVAVLSALSFAERATGERPPEDTVYLWSTAVDTTVTFAFILAIVLLIAIGLPKRQFFALRRPRSWRRAIGIAVGVFVAVSLVGFALNPLLHAGEEQGLTPDTWDSSRAAPFAANFVAFSLVGPVVEELTFRGAGFTLFARYGSGTAVLATGIAFGLWHGIWEALPVLVALGIGLAYLRYRTRSVYPTIALHSAFNALALTLAVTV
jgi:membrane protease YdiL (CAAX protease family)